MGLDSFHTTNSNKIVDQSNKQSENRVRKTLVKRAKRASAVTTASYDAAIEGFEEVRKNKVMLLEPCKMFVNVNEFKAEIKR